MELEPELLLLEAQESMEVAQSYRWELGQRLQGLQEAWRQIKETKVTLLQEVDTIEQKTIKPLDDCQKLIEHGREIAILGGIGEQNEKLWNSTKKASHIQLDSLPELDDAILNIVKDHIFKHGTVTSRPPVQIEKLIEKPGGIIDYSLQFCKCTSNHFEDIYVGSETELIVLHIDPNVDYQFRVCARGDGQQEWSPWSVPQMGHSTLVPHENIAFWNDSESLGVLYSSAPTYFCGQTLTFRVETVGQPDRRDSIGVCAEKQNGSDSLQCDQVVGISTNGAVFVNGKEMTNQLPAVTSGSTVTFDIEV
ncbi:unnamed protein product [Nyctereutes procyonoides]|uniref:Cytokine receptor-like factor 3 n=1 Tax=Nyctereutes procyonoides TaxID=34880 RepID=A0A811ZEC0_NYCPR|nr:unnamed protein product [Nyctereutes procyonoides]